jgi:hypothetical protein
MYEAFISTMAHPFEKIFEKAIAKSRGDENHVLGEAEKLMGNGYAPKEIYDVLRKLKQSLIVEAEEKIVGEAVEEFSQYVDLDDTDNE